MTASLSLAAVDVVVAAVFVLLAGVGVQYRSRPDGLAATLLWTVLGGLAVLLAVGRIGLVTRRTVLLVVIAGWIVSVPLWAGFVFEHTGRGPAVTRSWIALAVTYAVVTGAVTLRGSVVPGVIGRLIRVGTSVLQTALIAVGLFGVFLLVRATAYGDLSRGHGVSLAVGGAGISLLLFPLSVVRSNDPMTLPWTLTGFLGVVACAFAVSTFGYRLFGATPGTGPLARSSVLEEMSEAVLVVDREDRLVDANAVAERNFGVSVARDAGRPVQSVLGWRPTTAVGETTTVATPNGRRQIEASQSSLTNRNDSPVGTAFVLQDVTDQRTREQHLEVLNRVLRHNLRNDLDAIRAFAEALSEDEVADSTTIAERIQGTASDLVDIGGTVERAEEVLTRETLNHGQVDVTALVTDVADHVRSNYDCEIERTVRGDDPPRLTTDRDVLRTALYEIVENAVEHTACDTPTVSIDVASTDAGVRVAVRDHGPGIPDRERAVVLEGEETPLEHGTGVGLWFVSWAVTRLGGTLTFEDVDAGSNVVIDVPDHQNDRDRH